MKRAMTKVKDEDLDSDALLNRDDLYGDSILPFEKRLYEKNRVLFLIQSALLGISYAIVWPTLWQYVTLEFHELDLPVKKVLYGAVFIAYPVASMMAAYVVEKTAFETRLLFIALNFCGIAGNLIYSLSFHPVCLFIGRFVAGIADAFYIVIMRDVKSSQSYKGGSIAAECLAAFVTGLVLAQLFNAITYFLPFQLGLWKLNSYNYPGLTASLLFSLMALANRICLSISDEENEYTPEPTNTSNDDIKLEFSMLRNWGFKAGFISFFSFIHTYVVSIFEMLIPIIIYEKLNASALSSILLYGFIALLYAMILMFTLSIKSGLMLDCFMLTSVLFKMMALLATICIILIPMRTLYQVLGLMATMITVTFMWSHDDVMYNNLILSLIPFRVRDYSHNLRKTASKCAFVLAGFTAPFLYSKAILYVGSVLTITIGLIFMMFVLIRTFSMVSGGSSGRRSPKKWDD